MITNEKVLVVKSKYLSTIDIQNFSFRKKLALEQIMKSAFFIKRSVAENEVCYKQIIPYSIFRYKDDILCYKRSKTGNETRLHNLYSLGVGGHINLVDLSRKLPALSMLERARDREIEEEFRLKIDGQPNFLGFINDETNMVSKVHLGIIFEWFLTNKDVESKEESIEEYRFIPVRDLRSSDLNFETWSQIVINDHLCLNNT